MIDALALAQREHSIYFWRLVYDEHERRVALEAVDYIRGVLVRIFDQGSPERTVAVAVQALRESQPLDGRKAPPNQLPLPLGV